MDFVEGLFMAQGGSGLDFGHDPESCGFLTTIQKSLP